LNSNGNVVLKRKVNRHRNCITTIVYGATVCGLLQAKSINDGIEAMERLKLKFLMTPYNRFEVG
jgi:hypothetical protein